MGEKLLNTEEVAQFFRVGTLTIRNWRKQGKLAAVKIGRRWLYREVEIQRVLEGKQEQEAA
ncbi:MAG: helix-turn-helix domain-containing protein [Kouleothrix sp.]|jgi:excisionase family DNA binding protein|nr:helix-turn-helix domain-containing protein [Kouleothrix sp.]